MVNLFNYTGTKVFDLFKRMLKKAKEPSPQIEPDSFAPDLWALVSLSKTDYRDIYQITMENVAASDYGHSMSDDERHEVFKYAIQALKIRRAFFLPPNTPPELLFRESEMWTFAVFYAAIFSLYSANNAEKTFLDHVHHLSPIAKKWMKKRPLKAAKNYIESGTGELSPVFSRLSKEIEKQGAVDSDELNVEDIQRSLPHLIAHYSAALVATGDAHSILTDDGFLVFTLENQEQLAPTVRQNLKTDLPSALRACEGQGTKEIEYCLYNTREIKRGFLLGEIFHPKSSDKTRRIFIQKTVSDFSLEFRKHNNLTKMTVAEYCKRLIRSMATSHTSFSLSCLLSPFNVVESGICVNLRVWRDLLDHFRELASDSTLFSSTKSLCRLTTLDSEGHQYQSLQKDQNPISCVHIIDPYYTKAKIPPSSRLLFSLTSIERVDLFAQFERYCNHLARLKDSRYLYQCEGGHFMPHHAFEVFTQERLCTHAHWKAVVDFAQDGLNRTEYFTIETAILSSDKALIANSGVYFSITTMDFKKCSLPAANIAKPLNSIDWNRIDKLCRDNFGLEEKYVLVTELKTFILQELLCAESYITVSEAMNRHTSTHWEADPSRPDTLLYRP